MKASAMVAALIVIVVGSLIAGGLLFFISQENHQSRILRDSEKALYIAEAGLEDVLGAFAYALDTMENPEGFLDEELEDIKEDYDIDDWKEFGEGSYRVWFYDDDPDNDESQSDMEWENYGLLRLISIGRYGLGEHPDYEDTMIGRRKVSRLVRVESLWDNALFVGGNPSSTSASLNGNGQVRGTAYVLGEEPFIDTNENNIFDSGIDYGGGSHLWPGDTAVDVGGDFYIGNNYETFGGSNPGIPGEFEQRVPPIYADYIELETLNAWLNVKYGQVEINSNSAQVGKDEDTEGIKEYMDGVIIPDGIGGTHPDNVYTDVQYNDRDMFPEELRLPSLYDTYTDPDTGSTYNYDPAVDISGRLQYYRDNGLRVYIGGDDGDPDTYDITTATSITPDSNFDFIEGSNMFSLDGSGNMAVSGIVFITLAPGIDEVLFTQATGSGSPRTTINYQNNGVIVTPHPIQFDVNLYTSDPTTGDPISYPEPNAVGFMTPGNITIGPSSQLDIMAFFYAGGTIDVGHQTQIAGSLMAQEVTIDQRPSIFQVNGSPPEEMRLGMPVVMWVSEWFEERYATEDEEENGE